MKRQRKNRRRDKSRDEVESIVIFGDLTEVNNITQAGRVISVHGIGPPREIHLPSKEDARYVWRALVTEARTAMEEDRQFFCVTFGETERYAETTLH